MYDELDGRYNCNCCMISMVWFDWLELWVFVVVGDVFVVFVSGYWVVDYWF